MLAVALTPAALSLRRLVVAEAGRAPGVAAALAEGGVRSGVESLRRVLMAHRPGLAAAEAAFLAEQFQHLVLAGPQARAMGLGDAMDAAALEAWRGASVRLLMRALACTASH